MSDEQLPPAPVSSVDHLPTRFGSGWLSGVLGIALGLLGLFAVLCFHFPQWLTMADIRAYYPVPYVRAALHVTLVAAFLLAITSIVLRERMILGLIGGGLVLAAALLGGSRVPLEGDLEQGPYLGLDWFVLNLIVFSIVFIPIERIFARRPEQPVFRRGWWTDITYFFISNLLVQLTTMMTIKPATVLLSWAVSPEVQASVKAWPWVIQFLVIMLSVDLIQYWVHRLFHVVPWLWKFHAVHHSTDAMDWLAASRLHVVEQAIVRATTFVPAYVLGFDERVMLVYVVFITFQSTSLHANVKFDLGKWAWIFATPRFHHWHHAIDREAVDKNFAIHFPLLDVLFGSYYMPGSQWPTGYGVHDKVPQGWLRQLFFPFLPKSKSLTENTPTVEVHS